MNIEIKSWKSDEVLFAHDCENNTIKLTVEAAVKEDVRLDYANLDRAYLAGANLDRAYLAGARLAGACLDRASLDGAKLGGASLAGAKLAGAKLAGATLAGARLEGAILDGARKLTGKRPILQIAPIGSRNGVLVAHLTDQGVFIRAGCFFGSLEKFEAAVKRTHGDNAHGAEYRAAIELIKAHAELWSA